ncbi:hypothetical protein Golob_006052 [Gossypium lobatum]|uniref:Uncharacterized protein n=1 Tax=Gossypium lobatum TaxID=34289 RepID=A0A7J8MV22_9ROSI|nr:hypothetical protein [Gossypium lobatum]
MRHLIPTSDPRDVVDGACGYEDLVKCIPGTSIIVTSINFVLSIMGSKMRAMSVVILSTYTLCVPLKLLRRLPFRKLAIYVCPASKVI